MLYVLLGSNIEKAKSRANTLSKGYELVRFGEGAESFATVLSHIGASGLFSKKIALLLERPLSDAVGKALILEHAKDLAKADMPIIVLEAEFDAAAKKAIGKLAEVEEFEVKVADTRLPPSIFALIDAFVGGDRKNAWIIYRKLITSGTVPEEVHSMLAWQARALVLASKTKSAAEAGLKPFVYSKAKRVSTKIGEVGVENLSRELMHILHTSRMGGGDLEDLLEVFLLKKV